MNVSGSSGLLCSRVGIVCPCRDGMSRACEVAPGLPQGTVDLRNGACILHFTSVAVRIIDCCVVVSCGVGCDSADSRVAPSTIWSRPADWVADAAIRQPAWGAAVQASPPGQIKLPHSGQLAPEGHAAV